MGMTILGARLFDMVIWSSSRRRGSRKNQC